MNPQTRNQDLPDMVRDTIARHQMIPRDSVVVVGVSGGPDSVALLHVLHMLSQDWNFRIVAGHLDHGLRPDAEDDAKFVQDMAEGLGILSVVEQVDVREKAARCGVSVEEAGRRERYAFFERVRSECKAAAIATAHHRDDALETFFLRVLRGSSHAGLHGIPVKRGHIIRPLITATRTEILSFLHERHLPFRIDQTNLAVDTDRNFIRNRLFPLIGERFPGFRAPVERSMGLIAQEDAFLAHEAMNLYAGSVVACGDELNISLKRMLRGPTVLQARVVVLALYQMSGPEVRWSRPHVQAILRLANSDKPSGVLNLPGRLLLSREYDRLILSAGPKEPGPVPFNILVRGPGKVDIPAAGMTLTFRILSEMSDIDLHAKDADKVFFDADMVPFPLTLRTFTPGDRFRPWGMEGTRKLKKVLIDAKIPLRLRRVLPLVVKDREILWIPRVRRSAAAAVGPETTRMLEIALVE